MAEAVHGIIPDSEEDTLVSWHPDHVVKLAKIGARVRQCFLLVFLVFVIIWLFRLKLQGKSAPLGCSWQNCSLPSVGKCGWEDQLLGSGTYTNQHHTDFALLICC